MSKQNKNNKKEAGKNSAATFKPAENAVVNSKNETTPAAENEAEPEVATPIAETETPVVENVESPVAETPVAEIETAAAENVESPVAETPAETVVTTPVAETPAAQPKLPSVLVPTPPPANVATTGTGRIKKVIDMYLGMKLKDFNSIRVRMSQPGDLDVFGVQVPAGKKVFVVTNKEALVNSIKAMPLAYAEEDITGKDADGNDVVIGTKLVGYKAAKIRKAVNEGKKIEGDIHGRYKQHTVVVESPSTNGVVNPDGSPKMIGAVAYWDTALTEEDVLFEAAKAESKRIQEEEREKARLLKKEERVEQAKLDAMNAQLELAKITSKTDNNAIHQTTAPEKPVKPTVITIAG